MPQVDPKQKRAALHEMLVRQGAYSKSYSDFEEQFSSPEKIQKLHSTLLEHGATQSAPDEFSEKFFGDVLKKKDVPSFQNQMQERFTGSSAPLPTPSKPSGEDSLVPALTAEDKIRAIHQESFENKHGKQPEERTAYAVAPEFKKQLMEEATQKSDSLSGVFDQKVKIQAEALEKKYLERATKGEDPKALQAEFQSEMEAIQNEQSKLLRDQEELEYAKLAGKYEKLSMEKGKPKKDAGVVKSLGKQVYNVFANQLPSALSAADSENLPTLDVAPRKDGSLRFQFGGNNNFGSLGTDLRLNNVLSDLERRIDGGENLNNLIESVDHPDVRLALSETKDQIKGKATQDVVKSTFAFMLNRQMGRRKAKNLEEMQTQSQESAALLEDVPLTWKEAKENNNIAGYIGGAIGQGLGSSVAAAGLGVVPGARALEYSEVYNAGLQAKARRLSEKYGTQVTPEQLALSNDDTDVVETAAMMGNINAGLETVGTIFGLGKLAKGIFINKISDEIVKRSLGSQVMGALGGTIVSGAVGAATEGAQSANTIAGTKKLAGAQYKDVYSNLFIASVNKVLGNKIKDGQNLDDAAASWSEEDMDEVEESLRQGAIAEGTLGSAGEFATLAKSGRQMYIDKKRGAAITRKEAEEKIAAGSEDVEVINDPALQAKMQKFQVGITSATDQDTDIKAMMDEARVARDSGDFETAETAYNKILDIGEKTINEHLSKVSGVKVKLDRTKGDFFHYTEPTFIAEAEVPQDKVQDFISVIAGAAEDMKQFNAHISQVRNLKLGKEEQYGVEDAEGWVNEPNIDVLFNKPITEQDFQDLTKIIEDEEGIAGFTLHPDKKGINLYNVSKFQPYEQFIGKITKLKEALDARGDGPRFRRSVRRLLNVGRPEFGATRTYEQVRGPVRAERPAKEISTEERGRIEGILGKAKKSLSNIIPDLQVVYYNGTKEGDSVIKSVDPKSTLDPDANGFFLNNTIGIDLSRADASTAFHEAFHPIVDAVRARKPELFEKLSNEAANARVLLEDGNYAKYLDFTDGNKEEAFVEYLAHFAEDNSTPPKGVINTIKSFIEGVLNALGLKPSDFNLDLDKVKDLKQFAKGLSSALNKGKRVNVKGGKAQTPKGGAKFQKASALGKRKKLNRTAKRIASDANTEFKNQRTKIKKNPEDYSYDPLKFKDLDQYLDTLSDLELDDIIDIKDNRAVLAGIKLMKRLNQKGLDTDRVFRKLREIGTTAGQLVREFGELKSFMPKDIVFMVQKHLESMNLFLTLEQNDRLETLAKEYRTSVADAQAKRDAFIANPSDQTSDALDAAEKAQKKAVEDLDQYVGLISPFGLDVMMATILQGNLLTTQSQVTNPVGNLFQQATRFAELLGGDIATYIANKGWRHESGLAKVYAPLTIYGGAMFRGLAAWGKGWPTALRDITTGKMRDNATLEIHRKLKPLEALRQFAMAIVGKNKTLPVNAKGKVPISVYIEKAFEGTSGAFAESMFRLLYLGDKPFKDAAREATMYRMFRESGGHGRHEYRQFVANLTKDQKEKIAHYMNEATLSDTRSLAKGGDAVIKLAGKGIEYMADYMPTESMQTAMKILGRTLLKANIPFVRVPSNIAQYLIELIIPPVSFAGALSYYVKGDIRKGTALFVRGLSGIMFHQFANVLFDAGVVIASGRDDDEKVRNMKHDAGRQNGINIDALARHYAGIQDAENPFQEGDRIWAFDRFGVPGLFLAYNAEWNETIKEKFGSRANANWLDENTRKIGAATKTMMEAPFLHGSFIAQKAMAEGNMSEYFAELGNTLTALIIPNQVRTVTMARAEHILRAADEKVMQEFMEKQSIKIFPSLEDNVAGVYPVIGMFGESPKPSPGKESGTINALTYQFFNITKSKRIENPLSAEIFNLWMRTNELKISHPTPKISIGDVKSITMTEQDYIYAQMLAGQIKEQTLGLVIHQPDWKEATDEERLAFTEQENKRANEAAKNYIKGMIADGIEAGTVIFDEEEGTYSYTSPRPFDWEFAKKALED